MQTDLLGEVYVPPELHVTPRQRLALASLQRRALSSEALGAILHEYRRAEGGKGHAADLRCDWCRPEGASMGSALRKMGLVRFSRKASRWYIVGEDLPRAHRGAQSDEIPY